MPKSQRAKRATDVVDELYPRLLITMGRVEDKLSERRIECRHGGELVAVCFSRLRFPDLSLNQCREQD